MAKTTKKTSVKKVTIKKTAAKKPAGKNTVSKKRSSSTTVSRVSVSNTDTPKQRKEREPENTISKHVAHHEFNQGDFSLPYALDIYLAEEGTYKGEYIGILSQRIEKTPACKTQQEVLDKATRRVECLLLVSSICGQW